MALRTITHAIFDLDGLLLNTEDLFTIAFTRYCKRFGKQFKESIKLLQMGHTAAESSQIMIDALDLPVSAEEVQKEMLIIYQDLFPNAVLLPGVDRLIRSLYSSKVPICIATGSSATSFALKTTNHKDFISLFSHCVLGSSDPEVKFGKPAPDCFLVAAKRFSNPPSDNSKVLVFEDSPNGVDASLAAGMPCIFVPSIRNADYSKYKDNPDVEMMSDLTEFEPEKYGLPPYKQ